MLRPLCSGIGPGSALLALAIALPSCQQHRLREARTELARVTPELDRLRRVPLPTAVANSASDELPRLRGEHAELMRLWGQVATLRRSLENRESHSTNDIFFTLANPPGRLVGFQILSEHATTPEEEEVEVTVHLKKGVTEIKDSNRLRLIRSNGEWKWYVASPADVGAIPFWTDAP